MLWHIAKKYVSLPTITGRIILNSTNTCRTKMISKMGLFLVSNGNCDRNGNTLDAEIGIRYFTYFTRSILILFYFFYLYEQDHERTSWLRTPHQHTKEISWKCSVFLMIFLGTFLFLLSSRTSRILFQWFRLFHLEIFRKYRGPAICRMSKTEAHATISSLLFIRIKNWVYLSVFHTWNEVENVVMPIIKSWAFSHCKI